MLKVFLRHSYSHTSPFYVDPYYKRVLRKKHNEELSPVLVGKEWNYTIRPSLAGNNSKTWLAHTNIRCSRGSSKRGDMVPDPVLLQLITGLAASCVVCFIVVLLWSP